MLHQNLPRKLASQAREWGSAGGKLGAPAELASPLPAWGPQFAAFSNDSFVFAQIFFLNHQP